MPLSIVDIMNFTNYFSVLSPLKKINKKGGSKVSVFYYLLGSTSIANP